MRGQNHQMRNSGTRVWIAKCFGKMPWTKNLTQYVVKFLLGFTGTYFFLLISTLNLNIKSQLSILPKNLFFFFRISSLLFCSLCLSHPLLRTGRSYLWVVCSVLFSIFSATKGHTTPVLSGNTRSQFYWFIVVYLLSPSNCLKTQKERVFQVIESLGTQNNIQL
jgi:hypothetical protein